MFASIADIPSLHKILSNMPEHKLTIRTAPNIIRHETSNLIEESDIDITVRSFSAQQ
jgi:hypothetical protein